MFTNSSNFNSDISSWNVSNVTTMQAMFANDFYNWGNTTEMTFNQDLSNWDVSSVISCGWFNCVLNEGAVLDGQIESWTLPKPNFTNCDSSCN